MLYRVRHTTTYAYSSSVSICHNTLRLKPRERQHQTCTFHELLVFPEPAVFSQTADYFGNHVTFVVVQEPHQALTMTANSTVEVTPADRPCAAAPPAWERVRDCLPCSDRACRRERRNPRH